MPSLLLLLLLLLPDVSQGACFLGQAIPWLHALSYCQGHTAGVSLPLSLCLLLLLLLHLPPSPTVQLLTDYCGACRSWPGG